MGRVLLSRKLQRDTILFFSTPATAPPAHPHLVLASASSSFDSLAASTPAAASFAFPS